MIVEDAARLEFDGTLTYMYLFFTSCHCYLVNTRIYAIIISSKYRIFSYKKSQSYKKKTFLQVNYQYQTVMEIIQFLVFFLCTFSIDFPFDLFRLETIRCGSTCHSYRFVQHASSNARKHLSGRNRVAMRIVCKYLHSSTV